MLTHLCGKRQVQYARQEDDLKREREDLVRRGFVAQSRLNANQNGYERKLEAMTKIYKNVIDVSRGRDMNNIILHYLYDYRIYKVFRQNLHSARCLLR